MLFSVCQNLACQLDLRTDHDCRAVFTRVKYFIAQLHLLLNVEVYFFDSACYASVCLSVL